LASLSAKKRFLLLESSEFVMPRIARIARAPDLGATLAGGFAYAGAAKAPKLYVGAPDKDKLSAAITLAVKMAVSAGNPIAFQFTAFAPDSDGGAVLALETTATTTQPESRAAPGPAAAATTEQGDLFETWRRDLAGQPSWRQRVSDFLARSASWSSDSLASLSFTTATRAAPRPLSASSLSIAQSLTGVGGDRLWTSVSAADGAALKAGVVRLTAPQVWPRLSGLATLAIGADGEVTGVAPKAQRFFATQPLSIANGRLVAAGFLSSNRAAYVGCSGFIALLLAAATVWLTRNFGRRPDQ
jgi:hypothetical protein